LEEERVEIDDPRWIKAEKDRAMLSEAETEAAMHLVAEPPTTLQGALALLRHAIEWEQKGLEWPDDLCDEGDQIFGKDWSFCLLRNLEVTLSRLTHTA
jgi:hypothetical protein